MIRDLSLDEIASAAHLAAAALREDPGFSYILPDDARRRYRLPSLIEAILRVDAAAGARVRGAFDDGALVGLSAVLPSGTPNPGLHRWAAKARPLAWALKEPSLLLRAAALLGAVERMRPPSADYLHLLAVHPATQGRGIGAALLRDVLKSGKAVHLETFSAEGLAWYEARGFPRTAEVRSPARPTFWTLRRDPPGPSIRSGAS